MDGLLDDEDSPPKAIQSDLGLRTLPKFAKSLEGMKILIPIEREEKVSGRFVFQQMSESSRREKSCSATPLNFTLK